MVTAEAKKTNATLKTNHIGMSLRFLESASYWTGVFAVGLTAAAAVAGVLTWYFSSKLANVKDAAFDRFKEESNVAVAEATARAAEANRIAEEEKLARVKLETRLAPRSLSTESRQIISAELKQFAPQVFDILWYLDDKESQNLANEVFATLTDAGWVLNHGKEWLGFGLVLGVRIEYAPSKADEFGAASNALASALQKAGIDATVNPNPEQEKPDRFPDRIRIRVGKKP